MSDHLKKRKGLLTIKYVDESHHKKANEKLRE